MTLAFSKTWTGSCCIYLYIKFSRFHKYFSNNSAESTESNSSLVADLWHQNNLLARNQNIQLDRVIWESVLKVWTLIRRAEQLKKYAN